MSRNIAIAILATMTTGIVLAVAMSFAIPRLVAASDNLSLENKLKTLASQDSVIGIRFVSPIEGETKFWVLPEVFGEDNTMARSISEVGSDYFCVLESSEGAIVAKCIPFTNIAQITYEDM